MCGRQDDPTQNDAALTVSEAHAFRHYAHDLDVQAASIEGEDHAAMSHCCGCGSSIAYEDVGDVKIPAEEAAEVIYIRTGARGMMHVQCYLDDTDCYSLA